MGNFIPFRFDDVFDYVVLDEKGEAFAQFKGQESIKLEEYWDKSKVDPNDPMSAVKGPWNRELCSIVEGFDVYTRLYGEKHEPSENLPENLKDFSDHVQKHKGVMHNGKVVPYNDKKFIDALEKEALNTFKVKMMTQEDHHKAYLEKLKNTQ
jgi:hypothetical protein